MEVKDFVMDSETASFFSCSDVSHVTPCMLTDDTNVNNCKDLLMCPTDLQLSPSGSCSSLVLNTTDDDLNNSRSLLFLDEQDSNNHLLSSLPHDTLGDDFNLGKSQSLESYLSVLDDKCCDSAVDLSEENSYSMSCQIKQPTLTDQHTYTSSLSSQLSQIPLDVMQTFPMNFQCATSYQALPSQVYNIIIVSNGMTPNINILPPLTTTATLANQQLINNASSYFKYLPVGLTYATPSAQTNLFIENQTIQSTLNQTPNSINQLPPFQSSKTQPIQTQSSNYEIKKRAPVNHNREKTFTCDTCGNKYYTAGHLKAHKISHTNERPYACNDCDKTYRRPESLSAHHQYVHLGIKRFECDICGKKYGYYSHLNVHIKRVHKKLRPYVCNVCGKAFTMGNSLRSHMRIHSEEKQYECEICKRQFTYAADLQRHIRGHTGEKNYICNVCGKAFSESGTMTRHRKQMHNSKVNSKTSVLTKNSALEDPLAGLNMPTFLNLSCSICSKTFDDETSLIAHIKEFHVETKKMVKCPLCPRMFENLRIAKSHESHMHVKKDDQLKTHVCDICDKEFPSKKSLSVHRANHYVLEDNSLYTDISTCKQEDGKFQCNFCKRIFCHQAGIVAHRFSHSKSKPYSCKTCSKTFKTKSFLDKHSLKCLETNNKTDKSTKEIDINT